VQIGKWRPWGALTIKEKKKTGGGGLLLVGAIADAMGCYRRGRNVFRLCLDQSDSIASAPQTARRTLLKPDLRRRSRRGGPRLWLSSSHDSSIRPLPNENIYSAKIEAVVDKQLYGSGFGDPSQRRRRSGDGAKRIVLDADGNE